MSGIEELQNCNFSHCIEFLHAHHNHCCRLQFFIISVKILQPEACFCAWGRMYPRMYSGHSHKSVYIRCPQAQMRSNMSSFVTCQLTVRQKWETKVLPRKSINLGPFRPSLSPSSSSSESFFQRTCFGNLLFLPGHTGPKTTITQRTFALRHV